MQVVCLDLEEHILRPCFDGGDSTLRIYQLKGKTQVRITDRRAKRKLGLTDVPELRKPALYVGYGPGLVHSDEG